MPLDKLLFVLMFLLFFSIRDVVGGGVVAPYDGVFVVVFKILLSAGGAAVRVVVD